MVLLSFLFIPFKRENQSIYISKIYEIKEGLLFVNNNKGLKWLVILTIISPRDVYEKVTR